MQTILTVVLEVEPASSGRLNALVEQLTAKEESTDPMYGRLRAAVPVLHFMSMTVFAGDQYDPVFVLEANFDGAPGPFWAQLEAALGADLRPMLRCCKRPSDKTGEMYDAVAAAGSRYPIAPYLEAKTYHPAAFHLGNRGLDRERIEREGDLFKAARTELAAASAGPNPYFRLEADKLHGVLRAKLAPAFPWLDTPVAARITVAERAIDILKLAGFALLALFCLSIPGVLITPIMPIGRYLVVTALATLAAAIALYQLRAPLDGQDAPTTTGGLVPSRSNKVTSPAHPLFLLVLAVIALALYLFIAPSLAALPFAALTGLSGAHAWAACMRAIGLGLLSVPFSAIMMLVCVRWLELRDSTCDAPPENQRLLREMARHEDRVVQNHMISIVLVKPGILRAIVLRAGLWALGLAVRVFATNGYLGSMRTIHFAHWALVNNGNRLMFFSNFDGSWESYLDDFIEKAHGGLTLAWCNGVGFPPARFLIFDGASHGRRFKAWARHSMDLSRFWFSAYKDFTVNQIERQSRVAEGLRRTTLGKTEALQWAQDL